MSSSAERGSGGAAQVQGLLKDLTRSADAWVEQNSDDLAVSEVAELLVGYERLSARLEGAAMGLAASFSRREGYRATGHRSLQHWMQDVLRLAPASAMRRARTVEALDGRLGETGQALLDGDISAEHATAIAEAARKVPEDDHAEATLLGVAKSGDAKQVRDTGRRLEQRADAEAARRKARRAWEQRHISVRTGADGVVWIEGRLYQLGGEMVAAALEGLAAPTGREDERSPGQRRADALVELARRHLDDDGDRKPSGRPGTQVVGLVPIDAIEAGAGLETGTLSWSGPALPPDLEAALCMSGLDWLITDTDSRPLHYGRGERYAQPEQRAALTARDGGCRWPGCGAKGHWMIAHHTPEWDLGGVTDIVYLVFLCPAHHNYVHHGRWTLVLHDDACVTVRSPAGTVMLTESAATARARHLHGLGLDNSQDVACAPHEKACADGVMAPGGASGGRGRTSAAELGDPADGQDASGRPPGADIYQQSSRSRAKPPRIASEGSGRYVVGVSEGGGRDSPLRRACPVRAGPAVRSRRIRS